MEIRWTVEDMAIEAENMPLDIVYENDDFAIINKDAGINTHPTPGAEGRRGTLVNALLYHFKNLGVRSDRDFCHSDTKWNEVEESAKKTDPSQSQDDKNSEPRTEYREPSTKNRVPRTEYQEPSTEYQEPRTENREPSTKNSEPRTQNSSIINGVERPGIVHRLDKDTSGLIIIAKNDRSMHALQLKIAKRTIQKTYLALVVWKVKDQEGYIESFIGRDPYDRKKMTTANPVNPKIAKTKFLNKWIIDNQYTLLEVDLLTWRTHQIRVHLASIGYPILWDTKYGNEKMNTEATEKYHLTRQWLHAWKLSFNLFGQDYHFLWELKTDLKQFL